MKPSDRRPNAPRVIACLRLLLAIYPFVSAIPDQPTFLIYEFEDKGELNDFFAPPLVVGCGANIPMGSAVVGDGHMVMTSGTEGASLLTLLPEVVGDTFPDPRSYTLRMRVNFETHSGVFYVFVRTRIGVNRDANTVDITDELGYVVFLDSSNGAFGVIEESNCNVAVPHPEWPGDGTFAIQDPGFLIESGEPWYWLEISVAGDDDGGPVELTAMSWPDGAEPPDTPQFVLTDSDGLAHTATTREPSREVQLLFLNLFGADGQTMRFDDLTLTMPDGGARFYFIRGDSNGDGTVNIADAVYLLNNLFGGGPPSPCRKTTDVNGDGNVNIADPVFELNFLFGGAPQPPAPRDECGDDHDTDLDCRLYDPNHCS